MAITTTGKTRRFRRGIPTFYNGSQFRSRLEARWAAFFDLVGWEWDYEPTDLPGWIPDFVLFNIHGHFAVYVEVKPISCKEELHNVQDKIDHALPGTFERSSEVLILGMGPKQGWLRDTGSWNRWGVGPLEQYRLSEVEVPWRPVKACFDFCSADLDYRLRIIDLHDGNGFKDKDAEIALPYWRDAGNKVQWSIFN